jgi:hypothetical protein
VSHDARCSFPPVRQRARKDGDAKEDPRGGERPLPEDRPASLRRQELNERERDDERASCQRDPRSLELTLGAPDRFKRALPPLETLVEDYVCVGNSFLDGLGPFHA